MNTDRIISPYRHQIIEKLKGWYWVKDKRYSTLKLAKKSIDHHINNLKFKIMQFQENITLDNLKKFKLVKGTKIKVPDAKGGFKEVEFEELTEDHKKALNDWLETKNPAQNDED